VWSANHFYYNGEFFSCLLYSSLEAIFLPPAEPVVNFGQPTKTAFGTKPKAVLSKYSRKYAQFSIFPLVKSAILAYTNL